ncbi:uncharacterized protein [Paralichthys olivaceus]|uniref:uncharacterized protein n=1 Tax=Paralichthys olivaceus TaxID=8255 RepID=UPI00375385AD
MNMAARQSKDKSKIKHSAKQHPARSQSVGHRVASTAKTIAFHHGEIKEMEFESMELAHQNAALKVMMSCREAAWKREKQAMQDQIDSARQGQVYDPAKAMQTELDDKLKELKLVLKDKEKYIYKLSSHPKNRRFDLERVKRELNDKCHQIKVSLGHQYLELMAKLRARGPPHRERVEDKSQRSGGRSQSRAGSVVINSTVHCPIGTFGDGSTFAAPQCLHAGGAVTILTHGFVQRGTVIM